MSVGVRVATSTQVNVAARSFVHTAQKLVELTSAIARGRGLGQKYLIDNLPAIERGLRTWLVSKHLESMRVEIWDPRTDKAVEVYEFHVRYEPLRGGEETFESQSERLDEELAKLHSLRPGLLWRIIVATKPDRPAVEGWTPTTPRDTGPLTRREAGRMISSAACSTELIYFIEGGSSTCS